MRGPTNEDLRNILKSQNLPHTGNKDTLLERIGWADLAQVDTQVFDLDTVQPQDSPSVWDLKFSTIGPVIKRIPKAARIQACLTLTDIILEVINKNDKKSWERLLQYPRYCFGGTLRGGKKKKSRATVINSRIDSFITDTLQPDKIMPKKTPPSLKSQVSGKLSMGDVSGAVRIISSSDTVLTPSPEVLKKLIEKHPPPLVIPNLPPTCDTESIECSREDVKKALKSFKPGSAGGPDGLLPQHFLDLTSEDIGEPAIHLLDTLNDFFNKIIFPGKVPNQVCATIFGANLIALSKPGGGVRPIAVGFSLRRLAGKIIMKKLYGKCKEFFYPNQLGVGTPKGVESAVHAVRAYIKNEKVSDKVLLKIDFKKAFNQVSRDVILRKVKALVPEIYPFIFQSYASSSTLFYGGDHKIESREGVQQGDPLGPFLFSLATTDLIESCRSELKIFYLDDGTLAGDVETVLSDYVLIQNAATTLGLEVNASKCELYRIRPVSEECKNAHKKFCEASPRQCNVKLLNNENLTLLGSPVLPEAIKSVLITKLENLKLMVERITQIDAHEALFLLRNCFSIPKLTYFLRTAPCFEKIDILQRTTTLRNSQFRRFLMYKSMTLLGVNVPFQLI